MAAFFQSPENAITLHQKFAFASPDGRGFAQAASLKPSPELLEDWIVLTGHHRWHVKMPPNSRLPALAHSGFLKGLARLVEHGVDPAKSRDFLGRLVVRRVPNVGEIPNGRELTMP